MYCGNCGSKLEIISKYCSECGKPAQNSGVRTIKENIDTQELESRISALEKLGINNPSLIKRSFSTYGYLIIAQLIISGIVLLVLSFIGLFD